MPRPLHIAVHVPAAEQKQGKAFLPILVLFMLVRTSSITKQSACQQNLSCADLRLSRDPAQMESTCYALLFGCYKAWRLGLCHGASCALRLTADCWRACCLDAMQAHTAAPCVCSAVRPAQTPLRRLPATRAPVLLWSSQTEVRRHRGALLAAHLLTLLRSKCQMRTQSLRGCSRSASQLAC